MNNIPLLVSGSIIENTELTPKYFRIKLNSPELAGKIVPGQFFHIRVAERLDILLRRPFSVFDYSENSVSILYEVVGKGTEILSLKRPGEELDILGPLGNGFSIGPDVKRAVIIGGGIGIAPLFSWAKELVEKKKKPEVLIGARNKYKVLGEQEFKGIGIEPEISTDDGSYGYKGPVTDLLKERITGNNARAAVVYACGPDRMLKELAGILKERRIPGEVSLARHMACGIGVCLGCVVATVGGKYKRVCKDGPVFKADEILWD